MSKNKNNTNNSKVFAVNSKDAKILGVMADHFNSITTGSSHMSITDIAKAAALPRSAVAARLNKMLDLGLVRSISARVGYGNAINSRMKVKTNYYALTRAGHALTHSNWNK
jgi:DNA-binding Lrp family transcriptional regulator